MVGQNRKDIKINSVVDIVLKKDQRTGNLTEGIVNSILTRRWSSGQSKTCFTAITDKHLLFTLVFSKLEPY